MALLPRGVVGTSLFRLRDVTGRERQVAVPRRAEYTALLAQVERPWRSASLALPNGLAYLDVNRLTEQTVDDALQRHRGARAWILDLRGALADSSQVAARVLQAVRARPLAVVAQELHRYQSLPCLAPTLREAAAQCPDERETRARVLQGDTAGHYSGRLVALVDERTVGAMERLALALEATTSVTFIGTASAGSPADAVPVPLPGGLTLTVPAMELRRVDGSQWQRIGLTPVIEVRLTPRSYRNGGDEVLERAQQWVGQQLDTGTRRWR
jgi:C-terminal processing protease CtpA/Prc